MPMIRLLLLGWFFQPIYQHTQKAGSHTVHTFTIIKFRQTNFLSGVNTVKTNYIKGYFLGVLLMWANAKAIVEDTFHFEFVTIICNFPNYYFLTLYVDPEGTYSTNSFLILLKNSIWNRYDVFSLQKYHIFKPGLKWGRAAFNQRWSVCTFRTHFYLGVSHT